MKSGAFIILMFVLLTGCAKLDDPLGFNRPFDYSIDQARSCYCPQSGEPVRLFVAGDTIAEALWISTNERLTYDEWQRFRSIKGLLDEIARWDSSSSFQVSAIYDSVYHYPSLVSFTAKPIIVNDSIVSILCDVDYSYRTWNYIKYK